MNRIERPEPGDFPAYYAAYLLAAQGDDLATALSHVTEQERKTRGMVPEDRWEFRYAPGKWSTKEVFQHIIDIERIFSYRALCLARKESVDLPGMDKNAYQVASRAGRRNINDMMRELKAVRHSSLELFESFDAEALAQSGTANGKHITVPALGWIIAGHSEHHLRILRERYLV